MKTLSTDTSVLNNQTSVTKPQGAIPWLLDTE